MRQHVVIDAETDPFIHGRIPTPFIWGVFDGLEFRHYHQDTLQDLIDWLSSRNVVVYAHNGGRFDYHYLLDYFEAYDSVKIINGRIAQFRIGRAEFRDSYNILPVALDKIKISKDGATIEKGTIDYSLFEKESRYRPDVWRKIVEYLRDDCVTLWHAIERFQADYGRHLTQAGAAMARWKKISKVPLPKSDTGFYSVISKYYYGGRVECFRKGIVNEPFSVYDINSAYPNAMKSSHAYSTVYIERDGHIDISAEENVEQAFFLIETDSYGAFPFRAKDGLCFPRDGVRREFTITGWELIGAIETGTAGDYLIKKSLWFTEHTTFVDYIDHFYTLRLEAKSIKDSAGDLFAKLLMNSLYGKFGANPENYSNYTVLPQDELHDLEYGDTDYYLSGELGPWLLAEKALDEEEMRYYNVATAASITGYVRAQLWRAICACGIETMLYCDTDSITTASEGHGLKIGNELGAWKHEGDFDRAGISGKKMYVFRGVKGYKNKTASKGVRLTEAQLWSLAEGETVTHLPDNPTFSVHRPPAFVARRIKMT